MKVCNFCKIEQPLTEYHKERNGKDGHRNHCKSCLKIYRSKTNRKIRNRELKYHYGISIEQYEELLVKQNNACAICKRTDTGRANSKNFIVDHCHKTSKVRGLLCLPCNSLIGLAYDNTSILASAINYVENNKS